MMLRRYEDMIKVQQICTCGHVPEKHYNEVDYGGESTHYVCGTCLESGQVCYEMSRKNNEYWTQVENAMARNWHLYEADIK